MYKDLSFELTTTSVQSNTFNPNPKPGTLAVIRYSLSRTNNTLKLAQHYQEVIDLNSPVDYYTSIPLCLYTTLAVFSQSDTFE